MYIDPEVSLRSDKVQALAEKAVTTFRSRAPEYDPSCEMPTKNIEDLFKGGWLTCAVTKQTGGMGSNLDTDDPATYLQAIRVTARGCSWSHSRTIMLVKPMTALWRTDFGIAW